MTNQKQKSYSEPSGKSHFQNIFVIFHNIWYLSLIKFKINSINSRCQINPLDKECQISLFVRLALGDPL